MVNVGDVVWVTLSKPQISSTQLGDIDKSFLDTHHKGVIVYRNMDKTNVAVELETFVYPSNYKETFYPSGGQYATLANGYNKGKGGHCIYIPIKRLEKYMDESKRNWEAEQAKKFKVDPSEFDKVQHFEITRPIEANNSVDFIGEVNKIATYYGRTLQEEAGIKFHQNVQTSIERSLAERPFYYVGIDPYQPSKPIFDIYNPSGGPQTKEERADIKTANFARVYGMDKYQGVSLFKPRRVGLTYAQETMKEYLEAWMGVREVCTNSLRLEPVDWEEPMSLQELSTLGSSYEADQMRSEYKGWRHSFNRESQRGKRIDTFIFDECSYFNPSIWANINDIVGIPAYRNSDAVMAHSMTMHAILGLKPDLQPYGDEEVLLCPS